MKLKLTLPKPRNPVALAARSRQAGAHDKTGKVKRRDARQALSKALKQGREVFSPFALGGSPWPYCPA
jgi:hypothetical protein